MLILGIDGSFKTAAACLVLDGSILSECSVSGIPQSETLLLVIDSVLKAAKKTLDDIDLISVCVGPGSFTGLRIALSLVKGICAVRDIPICPFSSLSTIILSQNTPADFVVMRSRRDRFYFFDVKKKIEAEVFESDLETLIPKHSQVITDTILHLLEVTQLPLPVNSSIGAARTAFFADCERVSAEKLLPKYIAEFSPKKLKEK